MVARQSGRSVFVNRRRFFLDTLHPDGATIAGLLGVPADNAVVEREDGAGGLETLPIDHPFEISEGDSFLVTRQFVMGGRPPRGGVGEPSR